MKKIILAVALGITFSSLSTFGNTNPFLQLIHNSVTLPNTGVCGSPDTQPVADFCQCFDGQMIQGCKDHLHLPACTDISWLKGRVRSMTIPVVCGDAYRPAGVDKAECAYDVQFFLDHC